MYAIRNNGKVKQWWIYLCLGIILLIGLGLRLYGLTNNPHGFFCDEAAIGYNAYTLLHHGVDEYGKSFPIFFESFGDYKDPLQIYTTIPSVALCGLSELSTRIPSVVWGLITIIGVYLLTREIKSKIAGIAAAAALATMPWLIHYNRIGFELNSYAACWTLTLYFFLKAFKRKVFFFPAFLMLAITWYSYQPAKLLVPLLILGWILTYHYMLWRHRKYVFLGFLVFLGISMPIIISMFTPVGTARFAMVSIFSQHLPLTQTLSKMASNYFYQLSPAFFFTGDPTFITRHLTHGLLPLLPVSIPFVAVGLLYCLITIRKASSQLLIWLLCIYPIAGALVADGPFSSRGVIGAPLFAVLIGIGIELAIRAGKHKVGKVLVSCAICGLILVNLTIFIQFYFVEYPRLSADYWGWQYGASEIMSYFTLYQNSYDDFAMAGDFNAPEIFLKFYAPDGACPSCKIALPDDIYSPARRQLFAMSPDDISKNPQYIYHTVDSIVYPNGQEAFRLVTVSKK